MEGTNCKHCETSNKNLWEQATCPFKPFLWKEQMANSVKHHIKTFGNKSTSPNPSYKMRRPSPVEGTNCKHCETSNKNLWERATCPFKPCLWKEQMANSVKHHIKTFGNKSTSPNPSYKMRRPSPVEGTNCKHCETSNKNLWERATCPFKPCLWKEQMANSVKHHIKTFGNKSTSPNPSYKMRRPSPVEGTNCKLCETSNKNLWERATCPFKPCLWKEQMANSVKHHIKTFGNKSTSPNPSYKMRRPSPVEGTNCKLCETSNKNLWERVTCPFNPFLWKEKLVNSVKHHIKTFGNKSIAPNPSCKWFSHNS